MGRKLLPEEKDGPIKKNGLFRAEYENNYSIFRMVRL
jgi:hypothetical protein